MKRVRWCWWGEELAESLNLKRRNRRPNMKWSTLDSQLAKRPFRTATTHFCHVAALYAKPTNQPAAAAAAAEKYITRRNDWRWKEIILLWFYYWKWQKLFKDQKWPNRMGEISAWIAFYRLSTLSLRNRFGLVCAAHTAVLIYTLSGTSENVSHAFALLIITQTKQHIRVRREVNKHRFDLYVKHKMPNHSDKIDRLPSLRPVVQSFVFFSFFIVCCCNAVCALCTTHN